MRKLIPGLIVGVLILVVNQEGFLDVFAQAKNLAHQVMMPLTEHVLWFADHETGNLSQWNDGQSGAVFNTGTGTVTISEDVAHSGDYALKLTIRNANGQEQAARIFRWNENPQAAYYSAWFFFPQKFEPADWWNVFQFKSNDGTSKPMWVLNVGNLENGDMYFYLWDALNEDGYSNQLLAETKTIPVGTWTHVEAFYQRATNRTGQITIWQDGIMLYNIDEVQTAVANNVDWSVNNYTDRISPSTATIYVDDAIISTTRVGPSGYICINHSCRTVYLPIIIKKNLYLLDEEEKADHKC